MTRYSKVVRKRKRSTPSFLPESWQVFLARRFIDMAGFAVLFGGLLYLLALASYDHGDPSWNTASTASSGHVSNWLGTPGAYLADLMIQALGLAGAVPGLIAMIWGGRIIRRRPVTGMALRGASALLVVLLAAIALARVPAQGWLLQPYLGGIGGAMMLDRLAAGLGQIAFVGGHRGIALFAGAAALLGLVHAAAVTRAEIVAFFAFIWREVIKQAAYAAYAGIQNFFAWLQHYGDPDYTPASRRPAISRDRAAGLRRAPSLSGQNNDAEKDQDEDGEEESGAARAPLTARSKNPLPVVAAPKKPSRRAAPAKQASFALEGSDWELPPLNILQEDPGQGEAEDLDETALHKNAEMLHSVLNDFNVNGEIVSIHPGPVVTLYELEPAPGVKTSRVISLSDDIARSMAAVSVRCAVIPGRNVIGIELPNRHRQTVYMRSLMEASDVQKNKATLPLVLGKDIGGRPVVADLARMPHLLVAGTTGSGKSVAVNTMILSLLYHLPPEKCRFIMIDPKMLELSVYDDIPHLLSPVVTEPGKAVVALRWTVQEMEDRYRAMSKLGVRNIEGYNERLRQARKKGETLMRKVQTGFDPDSGKPVFEEQPMDMTELPYIVVVVDEFADLMLVAGKDVENAVQRLAQMARAAGIHLIMATQRPSVDVITGVIKANFPTRISFQVTSKVDSRTILNEGGAEQLLGMGDMLYMAAGGRITRVHGPFVSDEDVENVVNFMKNQGEPSYIESITEGGFGGDSEVMAALFSGDGEGSGQGGDDLYDRAVALVARERKASTSFIQRHLQIGYNRAARIIEDMEKQGIVSPANHVGKREVLISDYSTV